jgi:hypothetical protein
MIMEGEGQEETSLTKINIILNWADQLNRLVPTDN